VVSILSGAVDNDAVCAGSLVALVDSDHWFLFRSIMGVYSLHYLFCQRLDHIF